MATVDDFKAKLIGGGARANLFKATLTFPAYAAGDTELAQFMCKAAQLPASVVGQIDVPYRGRQMKIAGDRTYENWSVTIINDACDVKPQRFSDRIANQLVSWPWPNSSISSEHKADENDPFVGMASILAKQKRDECIEEISKKLGFSVGSGYPSDPNTKKIIPELLRDAPHPQLRWSWATVEREWNKIHENELPKRSFAPKNQTTLF